MSVAHWSFLTIIPTTTAKQSPRRPPIFSNLVSLYITTHNRPILLPLRASPESLTSPSSATTDGGASPLVSASDVVKNFYGGINRHDIASVEGLISFNCLYEDLIFPTPFVGRQAIIEFFGKYISYVSTDLQFVIDSISEEDSSAVGVTWHLEWHGRSFPFSKGCSFYRLEVLNGIRQIVYARDCVEPAIKPGESALVIIRGVSWLLQQFPKLADRL